jgi:hypothetical protein
MVRGVVGGRDEVMDGLCWPLLAVVGLCWPSLAFVGLCWPLLVIVGLH